MDWKSHFETQIDYQIWANQILFESLSGLEADALTRPEGLFFPSVHHTVDHLHVVLDLWAARLAGHDATADFHTIRIHDWSRLKQALQQSLRDLGHWLDAREEAFIDGEISYHRLGGAATRSNVGDVLVHLMGHFVHHRGQISAVATRLGAPAPEMDFLYYIRDLEAAEARMRG
ncbi:MAG: DinB family protein [Rhodocyclaceae bacterium]|nr:DinB family protein [Rhodocyclaceae bacterium]